MPVQWSTEAERDLLLLIVVEGNLAAIPWPKIIDGMQAKGYPYNLEGCRQHYHKLRRDAKKTSSNPTPSNPTPAKSSPAKPSPAKLTPAKPSPAKPTPRKRSAVKPVSSKSAALGNKNTEATSFSDDSEDFPTSSKKQKIEAKKSEMKTDIMEDGPAYMFKGEDVSEGFVDLERDELYE